MRPWKWTGFRPSTASRMSSTICPALSSTERKAFTFSLRETEATTSVGKGQSVIGRIRPTLMPSSAAMRTTFRTMRAQVPNAVTTMSASSQPVDSQRTSRAEISAYLACNMRLWLSSLSGSM